MSGPSQPRAPARVVPSWTEPLVAQASAVIGGPLGRHAIIGRARFWTPLRVLLLAAVCGCAVGWLLKAPCLQQVQAGDGTLELDWRGGHQYVSLCYTDIVPLWNDDRLAGGEPPYRAGWVDDAGTPEQRTRHLDYPVVTGYLLWTLARLTQRYLGLADGTGAGPASGSGTGLAGLPTALPEVVFFDLVAATLALAWLTVVWTVHRQRPSRPWDAALVAISPVVAVHAFTGLDAWAVGLAALGLCALARGRPVGAGVLLGLAGAAEIYPLLLLLPVGLVAWRRAGRGAPGWRVIGSAVVMWTAVNLPVVLYATPGWPEFLRVAVSRADEPDSVWFALRTFTGWPGFDGALAPGQAPLRLDAVVAGCLVVCCVGLVALARRAPRPPRLASLCFLIVAAWLLVSKAPSPQHTLWLVPLAVLALPNWRPLLGWMALEAALWVPRMYYYVGQDAKGLPPQWYAAAVLVRDAVLVALVVAVVRSVRHPRRDPVRMLAGADDPDWPRPLTRSGSAAPATGTPGRPA